MTIRVAEAASVQKTSRLELRGVRARYGSYIVCHDISLTVNGGEIVALLGPNGAGKSSLVGAISGTVAGAGDVLLNGRLLSKLPAYQRASLGLATIPDNRGLFASLTVAENMRLGARLVRKAERADAIDEAVRLFPIVKDRWTALAGSMSGGEQQMLAIAKCLAGRPQAIVLDEPTQGLSPLMVDQIAVLLGELQHLSIPILLVEQNLGIVERVAERFAVIVGGRLVLEGPADDLRQRDRIAAAFLGHNKIQPII